MANTGRFTRMIKRLENHELCNDSNLSNVQRKTCRGCKAYSVMAQMEMAIVLKEILADYKKDYPERFI